jgi:hypothetical protein
MSLCVDCAAEGVTTKRPIVSGVRRPRCATHHRAHKKRAKAQSHSRMVERVYSLTGEQYELLYSAQGGRCAICQVATGKVKRLAVEHDHRTGEVFGLACGPCNIMLGRLGREVDAYIRVINYLKDPPARRTLGPVYVPGV